jgi:Predicted integral membrane protein (DUF2269)
MTREVGPIMVAADNARNAGYDVVLLAHVLAALIGFGAVVVAGGYAWALRRSGGQSEAVRRYYRPGVNWAGRILFLVPVLGAVLISMSHGEWSYADGWVEIGLLLWAAAALVAEMLLWPAERELQQLVAEAGGDESRARSDRLRSRSLQVAALAALLFVVLGVGAVVMVAKP